MRFKASLRLDTLPLLLGATASLARVARAAASGNSSSFNRGSSSSNLNRCCCYMKLTPSHFFLNVRQCGALEVYVEAETSSLFHSGFIIESKRNNHIGLLLDIHHFHEALRLAAQCSRITMKLAKRQNQGVLSLEFTDALMDNLWVTQDCPIQTLQGEEVDNAGTPAIPACEWNIEAPRLLRLVLSVLERMRRLRAEEVRMEVEKTNESDGLCSISLAGTSELIRLTTTFPACSLLVAEAAVSKQPSEHQIARSFKTRRLAAAFKVVFEMTRGKSTEGLVACILPEDEATHPWGCVLFHSAKLQSLKVFCVLPTVTSPDRAESLA